MNTGGRCDMITSCRPPRNSLSHTQTNAQLHT